MVVNPQKIGTQLSDDDFRAYGVEPPSHEGHGFSDDHSEARKGQLHAHKWMQRGNDIFCDEGLHTHGHYVPPHKKLVGTDDNGLPIFEDFTLADEVPEEGVDKTTSVE